MIVLWAALVVFAAVLLAALAATFVRVGAEADQQMDEQMVAEKLHPAGNVRIVDDGHRVVSGPPQPASRKRPPQGDDSTRPARPDPGATP